MLARNSWSDVVTTAAKLWCTECRRLSAGLADVRVLEQGRRVRSHRTLAADCGHPTAEVNCRWKGTTEGKPMHGVRAVRIGVVGRRGSIEALSEQMRTYGEMGQ